MKSTAMFGLNALQSLLWEELSFDEKLVGWWRSVFIWMACGSFLSQREIYIVLSSVHPKSNHYLFSLCSICTASSSCHLRYLSASASKLGKGEPRQDAQRSHMSTLEFTLRLTHSIANHLHFLSACSAVFGATGAFLSMWELQVSVVQPSPGSRFEKEVEPSPFKGA